MGGAFLECDGDSLVPQVKQHFLHFSICSGPIYQTREHPTRGDEGLTRGFASAAMLHAQTYSVNVVDTVSVYL